LGIIIPGKNMKSFKALALIGLPLTLGLNLLALFVFAKPEAEFFSTAWWSVWFPNYLVWLVFAIIGFASRRGALVCGKNSAGSKHSE
jgi:hypothetical protein